ncbi:MAG: hypothetical protein JNK87_33505 [Bryobacterales bacterium]|nr:hypothetical protein [Bryobacterales bacterium]
MENAAAQPGAPPVPNGTHKGSVDSAGRLFIPAKLQAYLTTDLQATRVFVSTMDRKHAQIWTLPAWEARKKKMLEGAVGAAQKNAVADVILRTQYFGEDVEIKAGRITLPTNMRRDLKLENCPTHLVATDHGVVTVYTEESMAARLAAAETDYDGKLDLIADLLS